MHHLKEGQIKLREKRNIEPEVVVLDNSDYFDPPTEQIPQSDLFT